MEIPVTNVVLKEEYKILGPDYIWDCKTAFKFFKDNIGFGTVERFMLLCMDYDYKPVACSVISIGDADKLVLDIGETFKTALLANAKHIIIAHNHLGSSVDPTESDIVTTQKIGYVGNLLGIPLIDSIIVNAKGQYLSIRNYIKERETVDGLE